MDLFQPRIHGLRRERVLASPQFSDATFRNTLGVMPGLQPGTAMPTLKDFFFKKGRRIPGAPLPSLNPLEAWKTPVETGLRATWLGHSTVLIEIDGMRILTDPVWGERASPTSWAGPKRFQPVPVSIAALPPLDAVIISHDHYDHLDQISILELVKLQVPFYTSLGVGGHLAAWGVPEDRITELDWWESVEVKRPGPHGAAITITAAPSQHFSGRGIRDRNRTLWSSMVLRGSTHSVFFSGDTGLTPEYSEIATRLGPFDLVMLEVGAYHPAWGHIHLGPDRALDALALLGGGAFLPIHWGTFNLAIHDWDDPAERLIELAPSRGIHLVMPKIGEAVEPSRIENATPWWRNIRDFEKSQNSEFRPSEAQKRQIDLGDQPVVLGEPID